MLEIVGTFTVAAAILGIIIGAVCLVIEVIELRGRVKKLENLPSRRN